MKSLKMILGLALSTTSLGAGVAFAAVSNFANEEKAQVAEAAVTSVKSGEQFFVDCSQIDWYTGNAYIGLYFFGGSSTAAFSDFTQDRDANNMFRFTVPGENQTYNTVIALRKNNSNKNWDGEWNRVNDFSINGNGMKITSFGSTWGSATGITVYGGITSGSQVYANYNAIDSWWATGCDNYMFFCNAIDGSDGGWVKMELVHGTSDHLLECTVPGNNVNYTTMIATRVKSGETPTSNWSNVYNQSVDYVVVSKTAFTESNTKNAMVLQNSKTGDNQNVDKTYSYTIESSQRALWYGTYFISETDATCSTKTAPSAATWTALENEYGHMNTSAKNLIKNASASATGNKYEEAARRYDLIVSLRGKSNFMSRDTSGGFHSRYIDAKVSKNNIAIVIVTVSIGMSALFATLLFLKKKKHQ